MNDRISAWLENLGLGIYREAFEKNAITWDVLTELNQGDLESLGVLLGHRKTLLRAIAQLSPRADVLDAGSLPSAVSPDTPFPPERDQAERRQLTVVFCDLVDSTALSRRVDPEDLQDVIRRFLDACSQAIGRFNGYIAKYMGDGMLVYFGYPQAHENDAERAVHAGLAILDTVKTLNQDTSPSRVRALRRESELRLVRSSSAKSWGRTTPRRGRCSAKLRILPPAFKPWHSPIS